MQELEQTRAKAQYALEDAEKDIEEAYGKANTAIGKLQLPPLNLHLNLAAEGLIKTFTPPASPSKACPPPASPSKALPAPEKALVIAPVISGGRVDLSALSPAPSPKKAPYSPAQTYYIVYHGRGGMQGLFDSSKSLIDNFGPDFLCDGYEHCLSKKFNDANTA